MKKIHYLTFFTFVVAVGIFSVSFLGDSAQAIFSDVPSNHPGYEAINYVQSEGIVKGYDDKTYRPDQRINRAEFLKIVMEANFTDEAIQNCDQAHNQFADTKPGQWYSPYLCLAKFEGVVSGYIDGSFQPASEINFAEASKIINIALGDETGRTVPWYIAYIESLGKNGAIPISIESPDKLITRSEMAQIIYMLQTESNSPSFRLESYWGSTGNCIEEGCNNISISEDDDYRYIKSNGIPNHETGMFPNAGNPNRISEQDYEYRVALHPVHQTTVTQVQVPGVALNGVFFEPGTAERNGEWSYEALQDELNLGLDEANAHVQPTGAYHYHGIPGALVDILKAKGDLVHVGWAADGFPMFVSLSNEYSSSWQLKSGSRSTSPFGSYDGTYTQDFEYVKGSGDLDYCNGIEVDGQYMYLLTPEFPYISRCLHGTPDASFNKGAPGGIEAVNGGGNQGSTNGPPQAAINACYTTDIGESCEFTDGNGSHTGTCQGTPDGYHACKP